MAKPRHPRLPNVLYSNPYLRIHHFDTRRRSEFRLREESAKFAAQKFEATATVIGSQNRTPRPHVLLFSPHHPLSSSQSLTFPLMSHTHPTSTHSNFQLIIDNALKAYKKRTKHDLLKHPLAGRLQACNSSTSILAVLQEQVQELNQSQRNTKWLGPIVNVLHTFSETLGEGVGLVCLRT